jgi:ABC-type nickel/cobalt efflux system permease component RcnA
MNLDMALRLGGGGVLGLLLGLRHAFEPDHLAAVAALTAERRSMRAGALLGAAWGCGHTVSLLAASIALAVVEERVPRWIDNALELAVATMLMVLGARAVVRVVLARTRRARDPLPHEEAHGDARGELAARPAGQRSLGGGGGGRTRGRRFARGRRLVCGGCCFTCGRPLSPPGRCRTLGVVLFPRAMSTKDHWRCCHGSRDA